MGYVGIKNWPEKARLLRSQDFKIGEVETRALVFDCERHLEFIKAFLEKGDHFDPKDTLYFAFYRFLKGEEAAINKSRRFLRLFKTVQTAGLRKEECVIPITTDGARLDGSHRGSMAMAMGIYKLPVKIFKWVNLNKIGHILQEIKLKKELHHAQKGFAAYRKIGHEYLGKVVYTDVMPLEKRLLFKKSYEFKPFVALRKKCLYEYIERDQLTLVRE